MGVDIRVDQEKNIMYIILDEFVNDEDLEKTATSLDNNIFRFTRKR